MGFLHNQTFTLVTEDSVRPIDYSVSESRIEFAPTPTHVHAPRSRMHTGPWVFLGTKPLPLRQQILRDLLTIVYLKAE